MKTSRALSDRSCLDKSFTFTEAEKLAKKYDFPLSNQEIGAALLPRGEKNLYCFTWMQEYFDSVGDYEPNCNEIHLDPVTKKEVNFEYVIASNRMNDDRPILGLSAFVNLWNKSFQHVKIREYKACSGKCETCAIFSSITDKKKTIEVLKDVSEFKALHRMDYMSDRIRYKERVNRAIRDPSKFLSIITDGMQQFHTELPYFGNRHGCSTKIKQHLQGMTVHGKRTRMYRTVDHIRLGANLNIYILLLALEEELHVSGKLPGTLYVQIDGGPENANYWVLAWMEIIIALEIGITEIWLCRMRVGHTHADQDARFGLLWNWAKTRFLVTPQEYNYGVRQSLKSFRKVDNENGEIEGAELIDIFVVPDLAKVVDDHIDKELSRIFKKDNTQHILRFQKVDKSDRYPLGSMLTYRSSALDRFVEFVDDKGAKSPTGYAVRNVFAEWYPKDGGLSVLTSMPDLCRISPQPFVEGSINELHQSIEKIKRIKIVALSPQAVDDLTKFADMLPRVDESPEMFVERSGMRVPFIEEYLLSSQRGVNKPAETMDTTDADHGIHVQSKDYYVASVSAGASVRWRFDLKPEPARVNLDDRSDATLPKKAADPPRKRLRIDQIQDDSLNIGACL